MTKLQKSEQKETHENVQLLLVVKIKYYSRLSMKTKCLNNQDFTFHNDIFTELFIILHSQYIIWNRWREDTFKNSFNNIT